MRGNFGVGERGWSAARQHAARPDDDGCVSDSGVQSELAKAGVSTDLTDTPEVEEHRPTLRCSRTPAEPEAIDRERTDLGRDR